MNPSPADKSVADLEDAIRRYIQRAQHILKTIRLDQTSPHHPRQAQAPTCIFQMSQCTSLYFPVLAAYLIPTGLGKDKRRGTGGMLVDRL
jgi:hypothetical protein